MNLPQAAGTAPFVISHERTNDPSLYRWSKNVNSEDDPSLTDNAIEYYVDSSGTVTAISHETSSISWNIQLIVRFTAKENSRYKLSFDAQTKPGEERIGFVKNNIDIFFGRNVSERMNVRNNFDCDESPRTFNYILPIKVDIGDELMVNFNIAKSTGTFYIKNLSIIPEDSFDYNNAYEIRTPGQLDDIRTNLSGSYKLAADISLSSYEKWSPIGSITAPFTGKIDGNGFKITGLNIDRKDEDIIGLFGSVAGGIISNLALENIIVAGRGMVGGIAGLIDGGTIITKSYTTGTISAVNPFSGGIAGYANGSEITNSYSKANINSASGPSGGIAGLLRESTISNSYSAGSIIAVNFSGGIAGDAHTNSIIINSYSTGSVNTMPGSSGGIAGRVAGSTITNCYSTGRINIPVIIVERELSPPGGIAGLVTGITEIPGIITNNVAINMAINASYDANRIAGTIMGIVTISNNFALETMPAVGAAKFSNDLDEKYHGISRTDARLKEQSIYSDNVSDDGGGGLGWKFGADDNAPWKMPANGGYPILYWQ